MKTRLKVIMHFLILFIVFFFQSSPIIEKFSVGGITPNLIFVILFVYAIFLKDSEAVLCALIFGSATDLLFGRIYGVATLLLIGTVCFCILLNKYIYTESRIVVGIYCGITTVLYETAFLIINTAIWQSALPLGEVLRAIVIKAVYNGLIVLPVYYIARKIRRANQEVRL